MDILTKFNIPVCGTATFVLVRRNVDPEIACSSVGKKGLDFAVDRQFYIDHILAPEALKVREAISGDQYFSSFSFYHLDINCHYFKVNNLNLSENVKSVVNTIIYMYNSIP